MLLLSYLLLLWGLDAEAVALFLFEVIEQFLTPDTFVLISAVWLR